MITIDNDEKQYRLTMVVEAFRGAEFGIEAAIEDETITPKQVYSLLHLLTNELENVSNNILLK